MGEIVLLSMLGIGALYGIIELSRDDSNDGNDTTIMGTDGDDNLVGGAGDDNILGLLGNDTLSGGDANDQLEGNDGDDTLDGGAGNDLLLGGAGDDAGTGGTGDDTLRGATGIDVLLGGDGDDTLIGDQGQDWLQGDGGDDTLEGGADADTLIGSDGRDTLDGGNGNDVLFGGDALTHNVTEADAASLRDDFQDGLSVTFPGQPPLRAVDDGEVDEMDGGDGNDRLFVGDGDIATGGNGSDTFFLLDGEEITLAEIVDLDMAEDKLVYVYDAGVPEPVLELTDNGDGTQTLNADGVAVALLSTAGLTTGDIVLFQREGVT